MLGMGYNILHSKTGLMLRMQTNGLINTLKRMIKLIRVKKAKQNSGLVTTLTRLIKTKTYFMFLY